MEEFFAKLLLAIVGQEKLRLRNAVATKNSRKAFKIKKDIDAVKRFLKD